MRKHNTIQWLLLAVNTLLYQFFMLLISFLPQRLAFRVARQVGRLRYKRRRLAIKPCLANMELTLAVSPSQVENWAKRSFELAVCEDLESCLYPRMTKEKIGKIIELRGLENLVAALKSGKGAILYSGHVRGWYTFFAAIGLQGYKVNAVGLPHRVVHRPVERWFYERRNTVVQRKMGCRFLWMQPTNFGVAVQAFNALRRNEVVIIFIDLTFSDQNLEVRFLNGRARFPSGPAVLAQTTGAPLLSFFVHRTDEWIPQIAEIGSPLYVSDDVKGPVQTMASYLEERILQHPAEWTPWLVPRWELFRTWSKHDGFFSE